MSGRPPVHANADLIVDFDGIPVEEYAGNCFNLKFSLQNMSNRPVDLLEELAIKNIFAP
jgi:predicted nucleotidyltransferase